MSDLISRKALLEELEAQDYYGGFLVRLITNAPAVKTVTFPDGWVAVPIEPTHEMITRAFHLAQNPNMLIKDMYKAMVQMAPIDKEIYYD